MVMKFAIFGAICTLVQGNRRCASSFLASLLLQKHYKFHTFVVVQALGRGPRICMVGPDARLYCHAITCSNRFGMARQLLSSPQATVNTVARMLHATPVKCGHVKGGYGHGAIKLEGSMCTHRLVPYTRRHALLFGKYSRYAVFLNCFSNSRWCLWVEAWSGRYVLVCIWTNSSIAYLKWNLARSSKNASCAT